MFRNRKTLASALLVGSLACGGAVGALTLGTTANAATDSSTTATAASTSSDAPAPPDGAAREPQGPHSANGITETPLTGDELTKATAAAQTAEPGSTVVRAETDADGDSFEVHITKADGTRATVKLNADFSVKTVEADAGK